MTATFSVIIPCYNYGRYLERAVSSALEQQQPNVEIIVIDDGSTDNTQEVMAKLESCKHGRLRLIRQSNAGPSAVRNRGVAESQNEWLLFLDADDALCPNALSALAETIDCHPKARLIIGNHHSDGDKGFKTATPPRVSFSCEQNFQDFLWKKIDISNGACAMHRSLFDIIRYDESLRHVEDIPVFAQILANFPAVVTAAPIAIIYKHSDSLRHDIDAALKVGMSLEGILFDNKSLPAWAQHYRKDFRAKRALSLLKHAYRKKRYDLVKSFYKIAFDASPQQSLKLKYLKRYLMSFLK